MKEVKLWPMLQVVSELLLRESVHERLRKGVLCLEVLALGDSRWVLVRPDERGQWDRRQVMKVLRDLLVAQWERCLRRISVVRCWTRLTWRAALVERLMWLSAWTLKWRTGVYGAREGLAAFAGVRGLPWRGWFVLDNYVDGDGEGAVEVIAPGGFGYGWGSVDGGVGPEANEAFLGFAAQFEDK